MSVCIDCDKVKHTQVRVNSIYDVKTTQGLLTKSETTLTRGHDLRLIKKSVRTSCFQHFFTNRIINTWNSLPQETVSVGTVNAFKNGIDKIFANKMYCTDL